MADTQIQLRIPVSEEVRRKLKMQALQDKASSLSEYLRILLQEALDERGIKDIDLNEGLSTWGGSRREKEE